MTRSCTAPPLAAGVRFDDRCAVRHGHTTTNPGATLLPDVRLFVTPDQYTVNENKATWRFTLLTSAMAPPAGWLSPMCWALATVCHLHHQPSHVNLLCPAHLAP
jgi:hypothetical protein